MSEIMGALCGEGLVFFSRSNRLISHELKNVLAIISETLGLLEELVDLSAKGRSLEPGKLAGLTSSILEEVARANRIIKNMNRLAHSVDDFVTETEVGELLALAVELSKLDAASKRLTIRLDSPAKQVVSTCPLFLHALLYRVLHYAVRRGGPEGELRITVGSAQEGCAVRLSGVAPVGAGEFPTEKEDLLARALSARIELDGAGGTLSVFLPRILGESPLRSLASTP